MSRELNEGLFGQTQSKNSGQKRSEGSQSRTQSETDQFVRKEEFNLLMSSLQQMKKKNRETEEKLAQMDSKMRDVAQTSQLRFDRVSGGLKRMDESFKNNLRELKEKYASLSGKVTERKVIEEKIQELIDRHNQIVQNFENRLAQLQKVIQEQEVQMMSNRRAMEEAQREIARMKRL